MTDATDDTGESVWSRLRRRKVVQWGFAYVAAAWGLLQGLAYVATVFHWPEQVQRIALIAAVVGLPIALVIAWYHGDRGEQRVSGTELGILVLLLLLGGGLAWWFGAPSPTQATAPATATSVPSSNSIAVLPFVNMSDDASNEYFADGLSEELLNLLTRIPQLRVAARTSSFSFKGKDVDIATIASRLKVAHVLEGSVRKSGDKVRITAQLIKADDGYHLWSETYDRRLDDVFAVQDEIAAAVVGALKLKLLDAAAPSAVRTDPRAYSLYLEGKQALEERSDDSSLRGIELLQKSVEIAPAYAPVWEQLARAYATQAWMGETPLHPGFARARAAVDKALEVDPSYAPAHARAAAIAMDYDWNYPEARKRLQTALTLAPTDPVVLDRAANFLLVTGRPEQALEIVRWLRDRDPLNSSALAQLAGALSESGQLEAAEHTYRELLEQRPGMSVVHSAIGNVRVLRGDPAGALAEYEKESNPIVRQCGLPLAYAGLGREQEARALLGELSRQHPDWAICIAEGYAHMGDVDAAFEALDVGVRERDPAMKQLRSSLFLKPLHEDSRWGELLETMGLSDKQVAALPLEVKLPQ